MFEVDAKKAFTCTAAKVSIHSSLLCSSMEYHFRHATNLISFFFSTVVLLVDYFSTILARFIMKDIQIWMIGVETVILANFINVSIAHASFVCRIMKYTPYRTVPKPTLNLYI